MADNGFLWKNFLISSICAFITTNAETEKYCMKDSDLEGNIYKGYGDSFNIICTSNDEKTQLLSDNLISSLYFTQNDSRIPNHKVETLNSSSIKLLVKNLESDSIYTCMTENSSNPVCSNTVIVGSRPSLIEDLNCVGYNYETFTCTWIPAENSTDISYDLKYEIIGARGMRFPRPCPRIVPQSNSMTMSCTWWETSYPQYQKAHSGTFYIVLKMTNRFGTTTVKKNYLHFANVIPHPPDGLKCVNKTTESIYLRWFVPAAMKAFRPGVKHRIIYRSEYEQNWQIGGIVTSSYNLRDLINNSNKDYEVRFNLTGLQYAYAWYNISVSMLSADANQQDYTMWSKNSSIRVRTMSIIPASPPQTNIGSFEIVSISDNSVDLYVYWQQVEDRMKNGGNFEYHIEIAGEFSNIQPVNITDSYAEYKNLNLNNPYTFYIWSKNDVGKSVNKSIVNVPKLSERVGEPEFFRKIEYGNGYYELFWEAPNTASTTIKSYTIFWCTYDEDRPYQCAGYLDWEEVLPNQTYYNTTLSVPEDKIIQFAISANSKTTSSGMIWACTIIYAKTRAKPEDVLIETINSTAVRIIWTLDCLDGIESVKGYIIHFCSILNEGSTACVEPEQELLIYGDSKTGSAEIGDLKPYQTYKMAISVVNRNNRRSFKSDYKVVTTLDDAPQPPENLSAANVTNSTISIKWKIPNITNGKLKNYKIKSTNTITDVTVEHIVDSEKYTLANLKGYTTYKISVEACTSKCSKPSNLLYIRTQGGYPSKISQPISTFKNDTDIAVEWTPPKEPNGNNGTYQVKLESDGNPLLINVTDTEYVINDCGADDGYSRFSISVRAVNFLDEVFYGPWSDELMLTCETNSNLWVWTLTPVVFLVVLGLAYQIRRLYFCCKKMKNVEIKLPPGLASIIETDIVNNENDIKPQNENKNRLEKGNVYEMENLLNNDSKTTRSDSDSKTIQCSASNKEQKTSPYVSLQENFLKSKNTTNLPTSSSKSTSSTPSNYYVLDINAVPHKTINPNYVSAGILESQLPKSKSDLPQVSVLSPGYVQAGDLNIIVKKNS